MRCALVLLGACGAHAALPDAAPDAVTGACVAVWTGNFAETAATPDPCATLDRAMLAVAVPSIALGAPLAVTIDLGIATPGPFSSTTVAGWDARATRMIEHSSCLFVAGTAVVPHGTFALDLAAVAPPHGTLVIDGAVLASQFSTCGDPLTAHVQVAF